jgi:hypothetical protein
MENYLISLSEKIVLYAESDQDTSMLRRELHYIKLKRLLTLLDSDELKIRFWANIYNAFYLIMLDESSTAEVPLKYKRIKIAGNVISLHDIEYKILKLNNNKIVQRLSIDLFSSSFLKEVAVENVQFSVQLKLKRAL